MIHQCREGKIVTVSFFLDGISKATGIPADQLKTRDMHEIEDKLELRDDSLFGKREPLYRFVSREEYRRRERAIEKELAKFKRDQAGGGVV
jgi:hypothetical protein